MGRSVNESKLNKNKIDSQSKRDKLGIYKNYVFKSEYN